MKDNQEGQPERVHLFHEQDQLCSGCDIPNIGSSGRIAFNQELYKG